MRALVTLGLAAALCAFAEKPESLTPRGYVSDFADAIDANSHTGIEQYCEKVERATGVQIAVVTVNTLDDLPVEDFANTLFRKWGIGSKKNNEGILLLLAIKDRKSRVEVGYGLEPVLPDGFVGSILREMTPSLKESNYGQALMAGVSAVGEQIAKTKGVDLDRSLPRRAPPQDSGGFEIPWPEIIFALIFLFFLLARGHGGGAAGSGGNGGVLSWILFNDMLNNSRYRGGRGGGWGGGGFGGFDGGGGGGGGFGGFGGGDSGGGGASGSW